MSKKEVIWKIYKNYNNINAMMVEEMELASEHSVITGDHREAMWMKLFRNIIPHKYSMAQGVMIIDSDGNVSKEVDIAVFDEQYTPYVFQYNTLKFIPIEAVAIAIECKSTSLSPEKLKEWAKSIENLNSKGSGIARMVNGYSTGLTNKTQKKTRPIKILACTKTNQTNPSVNSFREDYSKYFDILIYKKKETDTRFWVDIPNGDKTLGWWGDQLNGTQDCGRGDGNLYLQVLSANKQDDSTSSKNSQCQELAKNCPELQFDEDFRLTNTLLELHVDGNPFLSLNLQLNQLLMLINNPMLFPHYAYAYRFNKIVEQMRESDQDGKESDISNK